MLALDFETVDPYISDRLGGGWVYGLNIKDSPFKVLGCAVESESYGSAYYTMGDTSYLRDLILQSHTLIMHGAQYDFGCLLYVFKDDPEVIAQIYSANIVDTEIMSRMYRSYELTHNLDDCAKRYLGAKKSNQELIDSAKAHGVLPHKIKSPIHWIKSNMDIMQQVDFNVIARYAKQDVELTMTLYKFFKGRGLDVELAQKFSSIIPLLCKQRVKGVRVDINRAKEVEAHLQEEYLRHTDDLETITGTRINTNSTAQLAKLFSEHNIKFPRTEYTPKEKEKILRWNKQDKIPKIVAELMEKYSSPQKAILAGKPSITKEWLSEQTHSLCGLINQIRKIGKIKNDFVTKIINLQEQTLPTEDWALCFSGGGVGKLYPQFNLMRARTGRFSCEAPNLQQVPSDDVYGPLCRSIFLPDEGQRWYSLDYQNQEGRLQLHYAQRLGCSGSQELIEAFKCNPYTDLHQKVADLSGLKRKEAKNLNLGLSYAMGIDKLAGALGVSVDQAKKTKERYNLLMPYLYQLSNECKKSLKINKSIKLISGRRVHLEPPTWDHEKQENRSWEYKALNMLIQGSASDQIVFAQLYALKMGMNILFSVHDELCLSGTDKDAQKLKTVMENIFYLELPVVVDVSSGDNWGRCKGVS